MILLIAVGAIGAGIGFAIGVIFVSLVVAGRPTPEAPHDPRND